MHFAAGKNNDSTIEVIARLGGDVSAPDKALIATYHWSRFSFFICVLNCFVFCFQHNKTPLHLAATMGSDASIEVLVRLGGDVNAPCDV